MSEHDEGNRYSSSVVANIFEIPTHAQLCMTTCIHTHYVYGCICTIQICTYVCTHVCVPVICVYEHTGSYMCEVF